MAKIFIAVRESSEPQSDGEGAESQEAGIREYIRSLEWLSGYEIQVKQYIQSTSYTDFEERKDLEDIRSSLDQGDVLAFWNAKRFSRSAFSAVRFLEQLVKDGKARNTIVGKRIFDLSNEVDLSDLVKIMADTQRSSREDFKGMHDGHRRWIAKGFSIGGIDLFGLKKKKVQIGRYWRTVYEAIVKEVELVKLIFDSYISGLSCADVAIMLNRKGYISPRGYAWQNTTILRILKNKRYLGMKNENGEWISPQIITEDKFNKVQEILCYNKTRGKAGKVTGFIPLRYKLTCGNCGGELRFIHFNSKKYQYDYFVCTNHYLTREKQYRGVKKCSVRVNVNKLITGVWDLVKEELKNSERCRRFLTEYIENVFVNRAEIETAVAVKMKEIRQVEGKLSRIQDIFIQGDLKNEEYANRKKPFLEQKRHLAGELETMQIKLQEDVGKKQKILDIEKLLPYYIQQVENMSWEEKTACMDTLVEAVTITKTESAYKVVIHGLISENLEELWKEEKASPCPVSYSQRHLT